jgi:putative ABC transport system permease protein
MVLVARSRGDLDQTANLMRAEIRALDKDLPVTVNTMAESLSMSLLPARVAASVAGALGAAALLLATLGLYGVTAYSVRQRMKELGLRAAIGAQSGQLIRLIVGRGMALTAIGLALGAAGAFGVTRFAEFLLYDVSPTDPVTFLGIAVLLTAAALAACLIPARRAGKADPMRVLRYE